DTDFAAKGSAPPCVEFVASDVVPASDKTAASGKLNSLFGPGRTALERFQNGFDFYSWLTFVALNKPDPHSSKPFGTSDAPTVWETRFFPLDEVIRLRDDQDNLSLHNLPKACSALTVGSAAPTLFVTVDDVAYDQPFKSGPLVDQQGHYSLNTIFVNATMRDY